MLYIGGNKITKGYIGGIPVTHVTLGNRDLIKLEAIIEKSFIPKCTDFSVQPGSTIIIEYTSEGISKNDITVVYDDTFFTKDGDSFTLISEGYSEITYNVEGLTSVVIRVATGYVEKDKWIYPATQMDVGSTKLTPVVGTNFTIDTTLVPSNANEEITYTPDLTSRYITKRNKNIFIVWGRINPFNIKCEGKYVSSTVNVAIDYYKQTELVIVYTSIVNGYYPKATDKASDWWETTTYNGPPNDYTSIITASTLPTTLWFDATYNNLAIQSIDYIRTDNITDMSYMFEECNNLTSIGNLSSANTSNVTNMFAMFRGCSSLSSLDLSWNTTNVTDMGSMFENCWNLYDLYINNFDINNVANMSWMFCSCGVLNSLDLSNWFTWNVQDMSYMFSGCSNLNELYLSNFDMSNTWNTDYMFSGCYNLTYLHLDYCSYDTVDKIINSTDFPVDNYGTIYCSWDTYNNLTPPGNWTFEAV